MLHSRRIPLVVSLLLALGMVGGAFWLSAPQIPTANALSTEEALRAYAEKDTDADGLPDWEEVLYKTDPANPNSVSQEMTDGEAVAKGLVAPRFKTEGTVEGDMSGLLEIYASSGTVTDKFSRKFIENFIKERVDGPLSEEELLTFVETANAELLRRDISRYTTNDLKLGARGKEALLKYIEDLDRVMVTNSPTRDAKNVFEHYTDFVTGDDTVRSLIRIRAVGNAYAASAEAMMTITVPPEVAAQHIDFANAYALLAEATLDMGSMDTDPLRGLIGFTQYQDVWAHTSDAFAALGKTMSEQLGI